MGKASGSKRHKESSSQPTPTKSDSPHSAPGKKTLVGFASVGTAIALAVSVFWGPKRNLNHAAFKRNPITSEVSTLQDQVRQLRTELEGDSDVATQRELDGMLDKLHDTDSFNAIDDVLHRPTHQYATDRLLGDSDTITRYQRGMLLHNKPVQLIDVPSMSMPFSEIKDKWATYNPSMVPITWGSKSAFLVTYRTSTWNLCSWAARGSPLEQLPVIRGKKTVTSKVVALIVSDSFKVLLPVHDIAGLKHSEHQCNHHTGMVRAGIDDGRLFLLKGKPWLQFAAVAPQGHSSFCFHNLMMCELILPSTEKTGANFSQVKCSKKIPISFARADKISEKERTAGRLSNVHQKNWVPFVHQDELYLIFTIEPFIVVRVDVSNGKCTQVSERSTAAMRVFHTAAAPGQHSTMGVHGGSPLIELPEPHKGELLGIGRIARGNTQYALFFFTVTSKNKEYVISRTSSIFCFASTAAPHRGLCETIQFAGGLVIDEREGSKNLVVTYGVNDCEAKIMFMPLKRVLSMLLPATLPSGRL